MGLKKEMDITPEDINENAYFRSCRESISSSPEFKDALKEGELALVDRRLNIFLDNKGFQSSDHEDIRTRVAENIKKINGTNRTIAGAAFSKSDYRHDNQMFGRDVKRWAAIVLDELFTFKAVVKDSRGNWEFWHE